MQEAESLRAVAAAMATASALDLVVDDAVVLSDSNRLVVRLTPCNLVARVTPLAHFASARRELDLARALASTASPITGLDARVEPRIHVREGFEITLWTSYAPVQCALPPVEYATALTRLHAGLRQIDLADAPHFSERIASTQRDLANRDVTPELPDADRAFLVSTLRDAERFIVDRKATEQLLHGEPHPGNLLVTERGPLFIDFENTTRGPVEYDLAWVPDEVSACAPDVDLELLDACRGLVLGIIAVHRWRLDDHHPSGRASGVAFLHALGAGPPWPAIDQVRW